MDLKQSAFDLQQEIVAWRRDLHKIPELSFQLHQTSQYIKQQLDTMHIPYHNIAVTGIVAIIQGDSPGPVIALRADMDALPIPEETDLPFASINGNMHACGHDAHMAMLLGAAKIISNHKHKLRGSVKLIFQPAEEDGGGAARMIQEGCMENPKVDALLGLHIGQLYPDIGNGQIGLSYGPVMAASSAFSVTVTGKSAHVATPHKGVDPVTTAAEMILALQKIISRELNPTSPAVLAVTRINGGEILNIIPQEVTFAGDIRTVVKEDELFIKQRIKEICKSIAEANKAEATVEYIGDFPATVNDVTLTRLFADAAAKIAGAENIIEINKPSMGNEDISYFLQQVPGTYFFLGTHNLEKGIIHPLHNAKFDIDEDVLWFGSAALAQAVFDYTISKTEINLHVLMRRKLEVVERPPEYKERMKRMCEEIDAKNKNRMS